MRSIIQRTISVEQKKLDQFTDRVAEGDIYHAIKWDATSAIVASEKLRILHSALDCADHVDQLTAFLKASIVASQDAMDRFDPTSSPTSSSACATRSLYLANREVAALCGYLLAFVNDQPAS